RDGDLGRFRRRLPDDTADGYPIRLELFQCDAVEAGRHIRVQVARSADLVDQLGGHGSDAHRASSARMLRDHAAPVLGDLCDGEAWAREVSYLPERGVVA